MLLPQTTEYALRAMAHLAVAPENQPLNASDFSRETGVPVHYLSKILRRLVNAKLLVAQKGPGGGFVLARSLGKIKFIDILKAVDYDPESQPCAFGWDKCDAKAPCPLHDSWKVLKEEFNSWANKNTLLDVKKSGLPIEQLRRIRKKN